MLEVAGSASTEGRRPTRMLEVTVSSPEDRSTTVVRTLGKLVTEKPVDFVGFDNVVEFNKNRQNDDNVVKAYKDLFS